MFDKAILSSWKYDPDFWETWPLYNGISIKNCKNTAILETILCCIRHDLMSSTLIQSIMLLFNPLCNNQSHSCCLIQPIMLQSKSIMLLHNPLYYNQIKLYNAASDADYGDICPIMLHLLYHLQGSKAADSIYSCCTGQTTKHTISCCYDALSEIDCMSDSPNTEMLH